MINRSAYASHSWTSGLASGPVDPPDRVTYCSECGIEDLGSPEEFPDLEYPECDEELSLRAKGTR